MTHAGCLGCFKLMHLGEWRGVLRRFSVNGCALIPTVKVGFLAQVARVFGFGSLQVDTVWLTFPLEDSHSYFGCIFWEALCPFQPVPGRPLFRSSRRFHQATSWKISIWSYKGYQPKMSKSAFVSGEPLFKTWVVLLWVLLKSTRKIHKGLPSKKSAPKTKLRPPRTVHPGPSPFAVRSPEILLGVPYSSAIDLWSREGGGR